jgi:Fe-S-cluster-containing hydrogenase component 2
MTIQTARTNEAGSVQVDYLRCIQCGKCAQVCSGGPLGMANGRLSIVENRGFGCIACGHCMMVCPVDCIQVSGRKLLPTDVVADSSSKGSTDYNSLFHLMKKRRSIRKYKNEPVSRETLDQIVNAITTAPMGIPPSDVELLIFPTGEKVAEFKEEILVLMKKSKWIFSPFITGMLRVFWGKEFTESVNTFVRPALNMLLKDGEEGKDSLFYHAPVAILFVASSYSDPVDASIAATYGMLAAESLELGTCFIGTAGYFVKYSGKLKKKYGLDKRCQPGPVLLIGKPAVTYKKTVKRNLRRVVYW